MSCSDLSHIRLGPKHWTAEDEANRLAYVKRIIEALTKRRTTMEGSVTRCKMKVMGCTYTKDQNGNIDSETVNLQAVYSSDPSSENAKWAKWTPSASFAITINNLEAIGKLSQGHEYFVDFTPAV